MSIIAGAISLSDGELPGERVNALRHAFDFPAWSRHEFILPTVVILDATLSLFGHREWLDDDCCIAALAGRLHRTPLERPGTDEIHALATALLGANAGDFLRTSNGTFVAVAYDKRTRVLRIASDSLGGRPLYFCLTDTALYFSTTIDVLLRLDLPAVAVDLRALAEQEAMCYPLGDRTVFTGIRVLTDNQLLTVKDGFCGIGRYFDWSESPAEEGLDIEAIARQAAMAVRTAVHERLQVTIDREVCLLSGGLDSRVIASEVLRNGRAVQALNLSREGTQDHVFASRYAAAMGMDLIRTEYGPLLPGTSAGETTARMLTAALAPLPQGVVFSGDGGGELLGLLLLEPDTCRLAAAGDADGAVERHLHGYVPSQRVLRGEAFRAMSGVAQWRLKHDVMSRGDNLEKSFQRSVVLNDLRCHLHEYFSRIDDSRVELLLPFYDRRVVESILRIPTPFEEHLHHRFYHRVLQYLGDDIRRVPWQVYPGRAPCPVAPEREFPDQWSVPKRELGDSWASQLVSMIGNGDLSPHLRLPVVLLALVLHRLRGWDLSHIFRLAIQVSTLERRRPTHATGRQPT